MLVIDTNTAGKRLNQSATGPTSVRAFVADLKQSLTYQGRRVAPRPEPDPELAAYRHRIKVLAVAVTILLALAMCYLAVVMINAEKQAPPAKLQPVTHVARTATVMQFVPSAQAPRDVGLSLQAPRDMGVSLLSNETKISISTANTATGSSSTLTEPVIAAKPAETAPATTDIATEGADVSANMADVSIEATDTPTDPVSIQTGATDTSTEPVIPTVSDEEREMLAKVVYEESDNLGDLERSMVVWTVLNRYDSGIAWFGGSIAEVITKSGQYAWNPDAPVTERNLWIVNDVIERWQREKQGETDIGRTLPSHIWFFHSEGAPIWHNKFYSLTNGLSGNRVYFDRTRPPANPYDS